MTVSGPAVSATRRLGEGGKAFGFLRLTLASLVIVTHTPAMIDGDGHRDPLTGLFHTLTSAELAVDGFFVISGFLICASYLNGGGPLSYLGRRVARIYPAFVVASLVCVVVVGPLAGGVLSPGLPRIAAGTMARALLLSPPRLDGVFAGTFWPELNVSAWTIQYEFLCYLVVLGLGLARLLRSPWCTGLLAGACLLAYLALPSSVGGFLNMLGWKSVLVGDRINLLRFVGLFLAGSTFYLVQDRLPCSRPAILLAVGALCLSLLDVRTATIGFAVFGTYSLLAIAALGDGTWLAKINGRNDVSYGVYLYAWPIGKLLFWWQLSSDPLLVGLLTLGSSLVAGTISWFAVERPVIALARRR